jgi:hypothetical protein|tara:strand:+ start:405 stop:554 length:150 start_codon:yes stop_codon:yes gene_type:complete
MFAFVDFCEGRSKTAGRVDDDSQDIDHLRHRARLKGFDTLVAWVCELMK